MGLRRKLRAVSTLIYDQAGEIEDFRDSFVQKDIRIFVLLDLQKTEPREFFRRIPDSKILSVTEPQSFLVWVEVSLKMFEVDFVLDISDDAIWIGLNKSSQVMKRELSKRD